MSIRNLRYLIVEVGTCANCHRSPGSHSIDGLCAPGTTGHTRLPDVPERCYRGTKKYAYVDLDKPQDAGMEFVA